MSEYLAIVGATPPLILWYSDSCTSSKKLSESRNKSYPAGHSKLSILIFGVVRSEYERCNAILAIKVI
jgi:hypothetical protein